MDFRTRAGSGQLVQRALGVHRQACAIGRRQHIDDHCSWPGMGVPRGISLVGTHAFAYESRTLAEEGTHPVEFLDIGSGPAGRCSQRNRGRSGRADCIRDRHRRGKWDHVQNDRRREHDRIGAQRPLRCRRRKSSPRTFTEYTASSGDIECATGGDGSAYRREDLQPDDVDCGPVPQDDDQQCKSGEGRAQEAEPTAPRGAPHCYGTGESCQQHQDRPVGKATAAEADGNQPIHEGAQRQ